MSLTCRVQYLNDIDPFCYSSNFPDPARPPLHTFSLHLPLVNQLSAIHRLLQSPHRLDDAALQVYKDGDYGSYLDLEASINEQQEEFDGFQTNKKNSIVLRTQLSVRVHTIIEKLSTSEGRELRRALFSLKQIFQEDKDLVHEFVQNDGLACLIKVGSEADQNYQNYILRALGQVMLYVDGMNGVMENNQTIQWLYTLISSKFRLVVKTALKLLLVFVEYVDSNCMLLIKAIHTVDTNQGLPLWFNIMRLLNDFDSADTELLIYAMTLINKCLNGIPDQDTYYDQTDSLEEQRIEATIQRYMSKPGTDLDLLQQFQIYEAVLQYEDGEDKTTSIRHLDENIRNTLRNRKSLSGANGCSTLNTERRKSRRHSTGTTPVKNNNNLLLGGRRSTTTLPSGATLNGNGFEYNEHEEESTSSTFGDGYRNGRVGSVEMIGSLGSGYKECSNAFETGVNPALRRRRERAERQRCFMKEQESTTVLRTNSNITNDLENEAQLYTNALSARLNNSNNVLSTRTINNNNNNNNTISSTARKDLTPLLNAVNKMDSSETEHVNGNNAKLLIMYNNNDDEQIQMNGDIINDDHNDNGNINDAEAESEDQVFKIKRENTVKDLTQKLSGQGVVLGDVEKLTKIGDMTGVISKAMEGLAKSKSQANVTKNGSDGVISPKMVEVKKSENELRWEELALNISRTLNLCDMDFTDLASEDETDVLTPTASTNGVPPPPPPLVPPPPPPGGVNGFHMPPTLPLRTCSSSIMSAVPPPIPPMAPPLFGANLQRPQSGQQFGGRMANGVVTDGGSGKVKVQVKSKKTVKLFWKEVRDESALMVNRQKRVGYIWDELAPVTIDTQKLEHLFESRAKDIINKKQQDNNKNKEIIVLDPKRSNAINIGMTKLPPPRTIKTAILKMDATIMNREGIEKLLTMLPTDEERTKIQEAQTSNPELPLGSAEQFLLTLASITELPARLRLWAFKLDFESAEREIAEPLMDLKQGFETLKVNKTFRGILSTLLSIGNFLNGNAVKGFQIEYLTKVPEVKDTVHKHSLLHHLCHIVMEKFPDATDLYSEIGAVTRASKVDFDELALNIQRLETDCKTSWDHLKLIAKHDGSIMKAKMSDFLSDCAERIILLNIIYRRIKNRFHRFLLWLGIPAHQVADTKANEFCRIVSEFALEYRTTRERVLQQLEKKANHRERNKTRGKMITESGKFSTKEDRRADTELRQLLSAADDLNPNSTTTADMDRAPSGLSTWRRARRQVCTTPDGTQNGKGASANGRLATYLGALSNGHFTDADDEILESLVKTATKGTGSRTAPRERKRTRHADRKSLRRTLKNGLSEEEKKHISTYIKGY